MTFPVSVEDFIAHQEALANRELTSEERGAIAAWVPIFNDAYEYGLEPEDIAKIDSLISRRKEDTALHHFLGSAKLWMLYANQQRQG